MRASGDRAVNGDHELHAQQNKAYTVLPVTRGNGNATLGQVAGL